MASIDLIPPTIHDGYIRSVSIYKGDFCCVIDLADSSTLELHAADVEKLCVNNFYAGNIVLDARVLPAANAKKNDVSSFFDGNVVPDPIHLLSKLKTQGGTLLLIDSSYGAIVGVAFTGNLVVKKK